MRGAAARLQHRGSGRLQPRSFARRGLAAVGRPGAGDSSRSAGRWPPAGTVTREPHLFVHRWCSGHRAASRRAASIAVEPATTGSGDVAPPVDREVWRWGGFSGRDGRGRGSRTSGWATSRTRRGLPGSTGAGWSSGSARCSPRSARRRCRWAAASPRRLRGRAEFRRICVVPAPGEACRPFSPAWTEVTSSALYSVQGEGDGFRYGGPGATAALTPRPPPSSASGGTPPATGTSAPSPPR